MPYNTNLYFNVLLIECNEDRVSISGTDQRKGPFFGFINTGEGAI